MGWPTIKGTEVGTDQTLVRIEGPPGPREFLGKIPEHLRSSVSGSPSLSGDK